MRLINVETFQLEEFFGGAAPPFAILSHTWGNDNEEVSFRNIEDGKIEESGIRPIKLKGCCKQARKDGLRYVWIDTCCIDKTNAVELGEAINSMFQWYRNASICYTYLSDVPLDDNPWSTKSKFFSSRWFERGWTLQELLAPKKLHFYNSEWCYLGTKSELSPIIEKITGIPRLFLLGIAELRHASIAQRMSWAAKRSTKRKEDVAYCLLGIFGVMMPMIYGEGDQAFSRLQQEIMRETTDDSILAWGFSLTESIPSNLTEFISGGVLAAAPSDFVNCGHIVSREQYAMSMNSFDIFGGSLRIHIPLHKTPAGETFGLLKCGSAHNAEQVIGIPLQASLSRGQSHDYIRPQGRCSILLPKAASVVSTKLIHIRKERQSKEVEVMNRRYWFYIEESVETNLELIDVEPRARWQKENSMIATATKSDSKVMQRTTTRFRSKNEGSSGDFIVVLDFEVQRSQMDARCHVMISSRETPLENVAQSLINMRQKAFGNQSASNGIINLYVTLRQEFVAGQPMFVVRLAAKPISPEVTVDLTRELRQLDLSPKEAIKGQLQIIENKSRGTGEEGLLFIDEAEKKFRGMHQLPVRGTEVDHQQEKLLLDKKADDTMSNKNVWSPLSTAAGNGHIDIVKLLLDAGNSLNSAPGRTGPLHAASAKGYIEVIKLLLERGADVNVPGIDGWTPLLSASNGGYIEIVKLLLERGADISMANKDGGTPISRAAGNGHIHIVELLLDKGASLTDSLGKRGPLNSASAKGYVEVIKLLLEREVDVNVPGIDGWTPLLSASNGGHIEVVKLLLENGADISMANTEGWTPLSKAAGNGHIGIVELLLDNGASLTNTVGRTGPLNSASARGFIEVIKLLLERGADVNMLGVDGWTPLLSAANGGYIEIVKLLLEKGADITLSNKAGSTALSRASGNGHIEVVKLLLEKGALF